jgi:hypothetical protein
MIGCWFLSPFGMIESVFCGRRYEYWASGVESRCGLYDYCRGWWDL